MEEIFVGETDAVFEFGLIGPSESGGFAHIEELTWGDVRTGGIPFDFAFKPMTLATSSVSPLMVISLPVPAFTVSLPEKGQRDRFLIRNLSADVRQMLYRYSVSNLFNICGFLFLR